ncbi:MAG: SDR family oxidoreductase [bacterium]
MSATGHAPVLVTGATGYVGGRLVPRLLAAGVRVRCLAREARKLSDRAWAKDPRVEIVAGDVGDDLAVRNAIADCRAACWLVHSMIAAKSEYARRDRDLARSFGHAAAAAGVERIIYLGGLGETGADLSKHLASRREVELALTEGGVPVTVLRAAMIIGSGSASFEILRYLVERLPVMVTPRWVHTPAQPIAIRDALHYLVECLSTPETIGRTLDIGGPEILTYADIIGILAEARGLPRRRIVPVPVLTPRLSSLWIHLVTPVSRHIARPLAEGLRNPVVCRNDDAARLMPHRCLTVREAIEAALGREARDDVETTWKDAGPLPGDPSWAGGKTFVDRRETRVAAPAEIVFDTVCRLGGRHGWYAAQPLWRIRGAIDRMLGGPGLTRGRRHADRLSFGDPVDFWRVVGLEPGKRLELRAEMKLPGDAELDFEIASETEGTSRLAQIARFRPRGLGGVVYWGAVSPFHGPVFRSMLQGIRREAEARAGARSTAV